MTTTEHTRRAAVEQQITGYWARYIKAACHGDHDLAETHRRRVDELIETWKTAGDEPVTPPARPKPSHL